MCITGVGLSGAGIVGSGSASETASPCWSSLPQRPQLLHFSSKALNSCSVGLATMLTSFTTVSKSRLPNRQGINRRRRAAFEDQRRHDELEFVSMIFAARRLQRVEIGVVQQMDPHHHERADMDRHLELRSIMAGRTIADAVAAEERDSPLVQPWQARGVETRQAFAARVPFALELASLMTTRAD